MGKSKSKTKKQTHKKQKRQSYKARTLHQLKHFTRKIRSRLSKHRRTHKRKRGKAKGRLGDFLSRRSRRRSELREHQRRNQQIARQKQQRKYHLNNILQELVKTNPRMHATKFKTWLNRGNDWKKWQATHNILDQFDTDRGRINFIINEEMKDLGRKSLTKDKAIECLKKTQTKKVSEKTKEEEDLLLWGTQIPINWIGQYIPELIKKLIIKKHGSRFEQPIMQKRIKYKDVGEKANENDINTCIHYENNRITIIHDFLISNPEEDGIEGSIIIEIKSPFKIDNINNISISRNTNQCGLELDEKERKIRREIQAETVSKWDKLSLREGHYK